MPNSPRFLNDTVNCTRKGLNRILKLIEFGGRPFYYLNSAFLDTDNPGWMGKLDLVYEDEQEFDRELDKIKDLYEDYKKLRHLQYEFIDDYEKLTDGVSRTRYSDGSVIYVNYGDRPFEDGQVRIEACSYLLVKPE